MGYRVKHKRSLMSIVGKQCMYFSDYLKVVIRCYSEQFKLGSKVSLRESTDSEGPTSSYLWRIISVYLHYALL